MSKVRAQNAEESKGDLGTFRHQGSPDSRTQNLQNLEAIQAKGEIVRIRGRKVVPNLTSKVVDSGCD